MRTWVELFEAALRSNLQRLQSFVGSKVRVMAVAKANAYGHGLAGLAPLLASQAADVGVANVEEALLLREAGYGGAIYILSPLLPGEEAAACQARAIPLIGSWEEGKRLSQEAHRRGQEVEVHLKVDTGMGRAGCSVGHAIPLLERLRVLPHLRVTGLATHFARADDAECGYTQEQLRRWEEVWRHPLARGLRRHAANSAALFRFPESHFEMVRPGLALYGIPPFPNGSLPFPLEPVLTWKTRIVHIRELPQGATLSYGATFRLERPSRIALLPVGYADGYPWAVSNRAQVLVRGQRAPVVGRVCMDLTLVDVTDLPQVEVGDEVVLLGRQGQEQITVWDLARWAQTIPYEILTRIGPRVVRRWGSSSPEGAKPCNEFPSAIQV